jgi:GNAT superfamily N-acetyltransferase
MGNSSLDPADESAGRIAVRPARIGDAEAITEAHTTAWQVAYRGIMPDRYLDELEQQKPSSVARHRVYIVSPDDPRTFDFVAEYDDELVGWLCGGPSRDDDRRDTTGEVWAIYVHPDYWRSGVGGALMTAAFKRLVDDGYTEAVLWVFEANGRARGFYERFGWRPDGGTAFFERGGGQAVEIRYSRPLP